MSLTQSLKKSQRLSELKQRASVINYGSISVNENGVLVEEGDYLDRRIIRGYLCKWGSRNSYGEKFVKGAFAKSIRERGPESSAKYKITFLWQHRSDDPLAVFAVLKEDDYGLYFETLPLDDVPNADRTIKQIRSKTLNQFSVGFNYVWDKIDYEEDTDSLIIMEADLLEGSVVTMGADGETYALRSGVTQENINDIIENFIDTIPKANRLEARQIFALQKSLLTLEKRSAEELDKLSGEKPTEKKLDLSLISSSFKL